MPQPETTIADIVLDAGIRVKHYQPGHTEHVICPKCAGGTKREKSLSITFDPDGMGAAWICHRGTCGNRGSGKLPSWTTPRYAKAEPVTRRPQPDTSEATNHRPEWLHTFFADRCIGSRPVDCLGIYATRKWFGDDLGERDAIVFPYFFGGELVNRKYRTAPPEKAFIQDKNPLPTLFNIDRAAKNESEIIFVEGEMDVVSLFECGIEHAVSLKDGAPAEAKFRDDDKRLAAIRTHADFLEKPKKIILAGDMDRPGLALREELARCLGRHRVWLCDWPDGCKDASDTLKNHGPDAVLDALRNAQPYPIAGLQSINPASMLAHRHGRPPEVMETGAYPTDRILHFPTEGRLTVITGIPGHGKTTWTRFVMVHTMQCHARRWLVFSPEMQPWCDFVADCIEVRVGKPYFPRGTIEGADDREILEQAAWFRDRLTMLVSDAEDVQPTLDWLLDLARAAVLRKQITDVLIDPWNELDQKRGTENETDYTARALQRLKAFALRYGCNVWVVVHPAKPYAAKSGDIPAAPGPYSIAGSAHWANKADLGITVHSPGPGETEILVWKTRFRRWGQKGTKATLDFDSLTGRYSTPVDALSDDPSTPHWQDNR